MPDTPLFTTRKTFYNNDLYGAQSLSVTKQKVYLPSLKNVSVVNVQSQGGTVEKISCIGNSKLGKSESQRKAPQQIFDFCGVSDDSFLTLQGSKVAGTAHEICQWGIAGNLISDYPLENKGQKIDADERSIVCGFDCRHFTRDTFGKDAITLLDRETAKTTQRIHRDAFTKFSACTQSLSLMENSIYTGFNDAFYHVDLREGKLHQIPGVNSVYAIDSFSESSLVLGTDKHLVLLDLPTQKVLHTEQLIADDVNGFPVTSVSASKSKNFVATWSLGDFSGSGPSVKLWDIKNQAIWDLQKTTIYLDQPPFSITEALNNTMTLSVPKFSNDTLWFCVSLSGNSNNDSNQYKNIGSIMSLDEKTLSKLADAK